MKQIKLYWRKAQTSNLKNSGNLERLIENRRISSNYVTAYTASPFIILAFQAGQSCTRSVINNRMNARCPASFRQSVYCSTGDNSGPQTHRPATCRTLSERKNLQGFDLKDFSITRMEEAIICCSGGEVRVLSILKEISNSLILDILCASCMFARLVIHTSPLRIRYLPILSGDKIAMLALYPPLVLTCS